MTTSVRGIAMCDLLTGEGVCPTCHHATVISAPERVSVHHIHRPAKKTATTILADMDRKRAKARAAIGNAASAKKRRKA